MRYYNKQIITNKVMNTSFNSSAMQLKDMYGFTIQAVFTGTPTGSFKLQASADPCELGAPPNAPTPTNWTDIANSSYSVTGAGNYMWNVYDCMYNWVRVVYTDTSGGTSTAVCNITFNGKGV